MGSRITRNFFKAQRNSKPTEPAIMNFSKMFSFFMSLISIFSLGYTRQIDNILIRIMSPHYKPFNGFVVLQVTVAATSSIIIGVLLSMFSPSVFLLKCTILCLISQFIVTILYSHLGIWAIYTSQLILETYSVGSLLCFFSIVKRNCDEKQSSLWTILLMAALNIGSHWSNYLTLISHQKSITAVYFVSILFCILASMAAFIIIVLQNILKKKQKSRDLDRRNWNLASIYEIFKIRSGVYAKNLLKRHSLLLLSAVIFGSIDSNFAPTDHEAELVKQNSFLWFIIICVVMVSDKMELNTKNIVHVVTAIFIIIYFLTGNESIELGIYHTAMIGTLISITWNNTHIYHSISLGVYMACYYIGSLVPFYERQPSVKIVVCVAMTLLGMFIVREPENKMQQIPQNDYIL